MLQARDRIALPTPFPLWLLEATSADVVEIIPLETDVVLALDELPASLHGDPADRIIAATARCKGMPLATWDKALRRSRAIEIWRA